MVELGPLLGEDMSREYEGAGLALRTRDPPKCWGSDLSASESLGKKSGATEMMLLQSLNEIIQSAPNSFEILKIAKNTQKEGLVPPFGSFGTILGAWTLWTFSTVIPPSVPASCFHFNPRFHSPTFPKCCLKHLKAVALDVFVGRKASVERLGLPGGAWGGLKVTRVQTTAA